MKFNNSLGKPYGNYHSSTLLAIQLTNTLKEIYHFMN